MIIYGEAHYQQHSREFIEKQILRIKPDIIIHELLFNYSINKHAIQSYLSHSGIGAVCDTRFNKDIFELALKINADLIGCDLSEKELVDIQNEPLSIQFKLREAQMLKIIKEVALYNLNVCVVVGDIHLRTFDCLELGNKSCLTEELKDFSIVRYND